MPRIRTRRDGVRELKVDDEVHEIPHDHELAPNPTFSYAYREAFFADPLYMSVSRSDMACANAFVALAAAHDLTVMGQRLGPDLKQLLDPAIQKLRDVALASTSAATVTGCCSTLRSSRKTCARSGGAALRKPPTS
jgi:hypothetical protein